MDPLESVLTGFDCICQKKSIEKSCEPGSDASPYSDPHSRAYR